MGETEAGGADPAGSTALELERPAAAELGYLASMAASLPARWRRGRPGMDSGDVDPVEGARRRLDPGVPGGGEQIGRRRRGSVLL